METPMTERGEEAREFLQGRVTLFCKVMLVIYLLGGCAHVVFSPHDLFQAWFVLYLLSTVAAVAVWQLCRNGARSVRFSRGIEAFLLVQTALAAAVTTRFKLPSLLVQTLDGVLAPGDPGYDAYVGLFQHDIAASFMSGMVLAVVLRAAIVPSRIGRTVVLTVVVGVISAAIMAVGAVPLEAGEPIRNHTPIRYSLFTLSNYAVFWTLTTVVCVAISRIIYGLRREARRALKLGQYTLEEKLGEGGMGAVYRARHAMMKRPTAVKLLHPDKAGEDNIARFEREVQLTAELTHPNTITIFDFGRTTDGVFYYAMELLDGADLTEVVEVGGPLPAGRAINVLLQVASALEEAHGIDFIHRDVKPANIILCKQGGKPDVAKLVDFGLVKDLASGEDAAITSAATITGTPLYMSPESITSPGEADHRSDIYALGAVGYFLLTGEHVFVGESLVEVCSHHLHSVPEPLSKRLGQAVPEDLEAVVLACLAKDPTGRPQSASELQRLLRACANKGDWGEARATEWWREHGDTLLAMRAAGANTMTPKTIALAPVQ